MEAASVEGRVSLQGTASMLHGLTKPAAGKAMKAKLGGSLQENLKSRLYQEPKVYSCFHWILYVNIFTSRVLVVH